MSDFRAFETETGVVMLDQATKLLKPSVLHKVLGPKIMLFFYMLGFEVCSLKVGVKNDYLAVDYRVNIPVEVLEMMQDPYDPDNGTTPLVKKRKKVTRKPRKKGKK